MIDVIHPGMNTFGVSCYVPILTQVKRACESDTRMCAHSDLVCMCGCLAVCKCVGVSGMRVIVPCVRVSVPCVRVSVYRPVPANKRGGARIQARGPALNPTPKPQTSNPNPQTLYSKPYLLADKRGCARFRACGPARPGVRSSGWGG